MKKAGIITTAGIAALVLAGGGVALGMNLAGNDDPTETGPETTFTVEATMDTPVASATPETTPDETATAEQTESAIPTATAYTEEQQLFVDWYRPFADSDGLNATDQDLVDALSAVCAGESFPFPDASDAANQSVRDGVENGYFVDGENFSYCD